MHTPGMVLHVRGLRGDHEEGWRILQACLQGSPQVSGDLPHGGMGTCLTLGFAMQEGASKGRAYPAGHEHADDTVAEELFGMLS